MFALAFVGLKYLGLWVEGFIGMYILLVAGMTGLILLGLLVFRIVTIIKTRNRKLFIPFFIGIVAILMVIFEPIENLIEKLKSPIVLYSYCQHTVTSLSLRLRQDKSFEYNAGAFMSKELYYGSYLISGDSLTLNFGNKTPNHVKTKLIFIDNGLLEIGDTTAHRHFFKITFNEIRK